MSFFENTRKPTGLGGRIMVAMMNSGHGTMADWGFGHITIAEDACILDAGCGGMTIYSGEHIREALHRAGFTDIQINKNEKGWICTTSVVNR